MKKLKNPDEKLTLKRQIFFLSFFLSFLYQFLVFVELVERTNQPLKERNKVCGFLHLNNNNKNSMKHLLKIKRTSR